MARRGAVVRKTLPRPPCLDPDILRIELSVLFFFFTFHDVLISSRCETRLFNLELEAPLEDIKVALVDGSAHFNMQWKGPRGGILSFDLDRPLPPFQMAATSCGSTAWESLPTTPPADREISRRLQSKQPDDWATSDFTASPSIESGTIKGTIEAQTRLRPQRSGPHRARTDLPVSIRGPPNKLPGGQDRSVMPLSILLVLVTRRRHGQVTKELSAARRRAASRYCNPRSYCFPRNVSLAGHSSTHMSAKQPPESQLSSRRWSIMAHLGFPERGDFASCLFPAARLVLGPNMPQAGG